MHTRRHIDTYGLFESRKDHLQQLKDHLDRTNKSLAQWIVDKLGYPAPARMTESAAIRIIRAVNNKDWWDRLPTMYFFDSPAEDVPYGTTLLHFTRKPMEIANGGFRYGTPDYLRLGMSWGSRSVSGPGFNYAFVADDLIERYGTLDRAFQKWVPFGGCVFFRAPAIKAWHFGDEIDQVIFWGPDARVDRVALHSTSGWTMDGERYDTLDHAYKVLKFFGPTAASIK